MVQSAAWCSFSCGEQLLIIDIYKDQSSLNETTLACKYFIKFSTNPTANTSMRLHHHNHHHHHHHNNNKTSVINKQPFLVERPSSE